MKTTGLLTPTDDLMEKVRQAFELHGFDKLSMIELAEACGFTRRSLYNYFRNKEEAFRAAIRWERRRAGEVALETGRDLQRQGAPLPDVLVEILDQRFGVSWRRLSGLARSDELSAEIFDRTRDIIAEDAINFQIAFEQFLIELQDSSRFRLKGGFSIRELAQILIDGVRGANRALPAVPSSALKARYRQIVTAILFGAVEATA